MASAAEQLAANFNFSSFGKATELRQRILFTLGALIVARLGTYIPMPGIDPAELARQLTQQSGGLLDVFNVLAGGAISRMAIFSLGIMPYISASIIIQLMTTVFPELENLKKEGEAGRKVINQYTRYGTVGLAAVQAYGIALGLEHWGHVVIAPGLFFRLSAVITLTGGTILLMWIGEQITSRGVGNGISLIIFAGIAAGLPHAVVGTLELQRTGAFTILTIFFIAALVAGDAVMERARRLLVQYPKRQVGNKMYGGGPHLQKLNVSGVIPTIFIVILLMPTQSPVSMHRASLIGCKPSSPTSARTAALSGALRIDDPVLFVLLMSIAFNPEETADNLKKWRLPFGIRPGKRAEHRRVLTRIRHRSGYWRRCLIPRSRPYYNVPFYLGGTSILTS
jgi:preprotein translocase subunit SecY